VTQSSKSKSLWQGVYPAATTQFAPDFSLDLPSCRRTVIALVDDGVDGLVLLGTVGENNSLRPEEKRTALVAAVEAVGGRVPLVAGVSELSTDRAVEFARDAEKIGLNALMLLPAMVYVPTPEELYTHFKTVAESTSLPIMLYNNPPAYRVSIELQTLEQLAKIPNIVAVKESAPDPRRIYRWFMPLLHLDAEHDLVQSIKLAEQVMGRGSERVRMPRMVLSGARRAEVIAMVERCAKARPTRQPGVAA